MNYVRQKAGKNKTRIVRISNRPINIPNPNIHLARSGNDEKFPVGPIMLPIPGPTFATAVIEPEILVVGSNPIADRQPAMMMIVAKKVIAKATIDRTISSLTGRLL